MKYDVRIDVEILIRRVDCGRDLDLVELYEELARLARGKAAALGQLCGSRGLAAKAVGLPDLWDFPRSGASCLEAVEAMGERVVLCDRELQRIARVKGGKPTTTGGTTGSAIERHR